MLLLRFLMSIKIFFFFGVLVFNALSTDPRLICLYRQFRSRPDCILSVHCLPLPDRGPEWVSGKVLIHNLGVLGSTHTGSSGFFMGVSFGKTLQSFILVLMKPRKDMNNVSCRCDMTEILLKVVLKKKFNQSVSLYQRYLQVYKALKFHYLYLYY